MQKIDELTQRNSLILLEFYNRMKGVIANRYDKGKGFQFALLDKNLNELMELMCRNNELIREEFRKKEAGGA